MAPQPKKSATGLKKSFRSIIGCVNPAQGPLLVTFYCEMVTNLCLNPVHAPL